MAALTTPHVNNCGHCGRFTRHPDAYAPWGSAADQEPPDPVLLCEACADREYRRTLARILRDGLPPYEHRSRWVPSAAEHRARGVARALWRHGLAERPTLHVRARYEMTGTRQVWWCACGRPERHPAHDIGEARRLSIRWCQFRKRHGRNIGRTKIQEWCTCGWTTGPLRRDDGCPPNVDYLTAGRLLREHLEHERSEHDLGH